MAQVQVQPVNDEAIPGVIDLQGANVKLDDSICLPTEYGTKTPVTVKWTQDTQWNTKLMSHQRSATYFTFTTFSVPPGKQREVQVFIASEYLDPSFEWHPDHFSKKVVDGQQDGQKTCKVDKSWQYGILGTNDIFLVYHPKSRKIYSHRFTSAASERITLLNGLLTGSTAAASSTETIKAIGVLDSILAVAGINAIQSAIGGVSKAAGEVASQYLKNF